MTALLFIGSDCFEEPEQFVPERWTTRPDMVRNSKAFSPFGTGTLKSGPQAFGVDHFSY
jgi:hypothetical protein